MSAPESVLSIADGLDSISEHCAALESAATLLDYSRHWRAATALRVIAEEEAGKFLILLDAVRCGRKRQKVFAEQLERSHDHLARELSVATVSIRPATFAELLSYLEGLRA
jgi:AbiV family abortive infection protein